MSKSSNWPGGQNLGHSNYTLRFPRQATGGYAPGSEKIPRCAWCGAAVVVAVFFGLAYLGAAAGF